jgi:DNA (cytosine-5)-methyltransferase 1
MNFLSLFSGIGGLDLGLERAGMRCVGQVEIDPFCRRVLAKHWPDVPRFEDVRTFDPKQINERIDLIAGGFPCQDISNAGKRAGIDGERSGLWSEFARIVRQVRPGYVFVENVPALLNRGIDRVLGDLAACGFGAEWDCVPAAAVGAPHIRDRVFIIGYRETEADPGTGSQRRILAYTAFDRQRADKNGAERPALQNVVTDAERSGAELADAECSGRKSARSGHGQTRTRLGRGRSANGSNQVVVADANREGLSLARNSRAIGACAPGIFARTAIARDSWWSTEPDVGRVAHGVPARVDRLKGLGNAVVPQVAELIGRAIMQAHAAQEVT